MIFYVFQMFHSEKIAIFAILLQYSDISVIDFVMLFKIFHLGFLEILHQCSVALSCDLL